MEGWTYLLIAIMSMAVGAIGMHLWNTRRECCTDDTENTVATSLVSENYVSSVVATPAPSLDTVLQTADTFEPESSAVSAHNNV